jgi:F-type H+-transporting ATPase subunit b
MDLNATLFGQMITFAIFVWFTMSKIWPLLNAQLETRKRIIADGLAAAEKGLLILATSEEEAAKKIHEAKLQCYKLLENADQEAALILESARLAARKERDDIIAAGHLSIDRAVLKAKFELQNQVVDLAILGAEKILQRDINVEDNKKILQDLAKNLT